MPGPLRRFPWLLAAAATACAGASGRAGVPLKADAGFERWRAAASAATISPVAPRPGDLLRSWTAPDGRTIRVVVAMPHPRGGAPTVRVGPVAAGADARPVLDAALATVRREGAARLVVAPGTYTFRSLEKGGAAHLVIDGVSDLTVDATGATFVFTRNATGLSIGAAKRVRVVGLVVRTALRTASTGRFERRPDGVVLALDDAPPPGTGVGVASVVEIGSGGFRHGGVRLMFPPGSSDAPVREGAVFRSPRFRNIADGRTVLVFHQWYGGVAIEAGSGRGPDQAEDISLDHVAVRSSPGMGILAYGVRRGFAVTHSAVAPDGSDPLSAEYDGIHVEASGGDVLLSDDLVARTGDDAINLNAPVFAITRVPGDDLVFGPWSRFIAPGDPVALFDADDHFLRTDRVTAVRALGGLDHAVTLAGGDAGATPGGLMRDLALGDDRYAVENNVVRDCNCHGLLAQDPDGLVAGNSFLHLDRNAIRLLTSTGLFKEGIGAFDVVIRDNVIADTGPDQIPALPWAAITAYAVMRPLRLADHLADADLLIAGNRITGTDDGCITIADAENVTLTGNACTDTWRTAPGRAPIAALDASDVRRSGAPL